MALLLAQPQHVTPMWVGLAEATNRWLWRWSPWHLRLLNTDLADRATRWRQQLRDAEREVVSLSHSLERIRRTKVHVEIVDERNRHRRF